MEKFVPLPERVRYMMLKHALDHDCSAETLAKRLDWPVKKVRAIAMARCKIRIDDMAQWFFCVDGSVLHFTMTPKATSA